MRRLLKYFIVMFLCCARVHSIASADYPIEQAEISFVNDHFHSVFVNGIEVKSWETKKCTLVRGEIFIIREGFINGRTFSFAHSQRYKSIILKKEAKITLSALSQQSRNRVIYTQECCFLKQ